VADAAPATIAWNLGRPPEAATLTRDTLWELVTQGRWGDQGGVTTVVIHAPSDRVAFVHIAVMCDKCGNMLYQHEVRSHGEQVEMVCPP
jgi:hypothetical protein